LVAKILHVANIKHPEQEKHGEQIRSIKDYLVATHIKNKAPKEFRTCRNSSMGRKLGSDVIFLGCNSVGYESTTIGRLI